MRLLKLAVVISLLAVGVLCPSSMQAARANAEGTTVVSDTAARDFTACPLPIPNCLPEYVFDFKRCRCVPRP